MRTETLKDQITRLQIKFGSNAFDSETVSLIYREVNSISDGEFISIIDSMIGSRPHNRAPLVIDFREARLKLEKNKFNRLSNSLEVFVEDPINKQSLNEFLKAKFPGCKTLHEAVEVRRLQIMLKKADDPTYDPLQDLEWK